jgi:hypothetical protein
VSQWLTEHRRSVTSQYGEDGILQAIFDRIGVRHKWFCEFGAWEGEHLSNTFSLLRDHRWAGVMIEGDAERAVALQSKQALYPKLHAMHAFVQATGPQSLDNLLSKTPIPRDFDLLSIDIDNDDYFVWQHLENYRPRVVIIEINVQFGPDSYVIPRLGYSGFTERSGCSFAAMVQLAKSKGYELAAHTPNGIFVERETVHLLGVQPDGWRELFDASVMERNPMRRLRTALGDIVRGRVGRSTWR